MADNDLQLICPACGKPMKKVYISSAKCNIDVCLDGCGGIYFDNREFKKMDEQAEDIHELLEAIDGKTFDKVDTTQTRICPYCETPMVKNFASAKKEIEIDECYTCGAVFLDCGELQAIRGQFKTEEERSTHYNKTFNLEHPEAFEYISDMDTSINYKRVDRASERGEQIQKLNGFISKLFR